MGECFFYFCFSTGNTPGANSAHTMTAAAESVPEEHKQNHSGLFSAGL